MADNRFSRMIQTARDNQDGSPVVSELEPQPTPRRAEHAKKGRGRPATGKRSDPDYESTTVFLRRETKSAAAKLLIDDRRQDLSEVLEQLLAAWIKRKA